MQLRKQWQDWIAELSRYHASPDSVAWGGAVGTFIAILPTPGFNILLGLLMLAAFPKMNKFALVGALAFWNPLVCTPLYWLALQIGDALFGATEIVKYKLMLLDQIYQYSRRFLAGIGIIASVMSLVVYAGLWSIIHWNQRER